ncbi:hypothetical protein [Psychromonas antarctica]|uniref:hypothetical protein n=1 Tax=Psychromonas antarctica TaxID=67573 RepID=UPI001EE932AE|nr:hypothetical protein [Psychromonas antarctica]MCG6202785.1 hypothetical protein [Psychromonas antarctica]
MNKLKNITAVGLLLFFLGGCSLTTQIQPTDANVPVAIAPFNGEYSIAFNIANQTDLTKDYPFAGKIHRSPLKDFTKQEVIETKSKLESSRSRGGVSEAIGLFNVLTGNLTGVIDIAGGMATDLSSSSDRHPSISSRWIVSVDASEYKNESEAKREILDKIQTAVLNEFKKYDINLLETKRNGLTFHYCQLKSNEFVELGITHHTDSSDKKVEPAIKQMVSFNGVDKLSYAIGLRDAYSYDKLVYPVNLELFTHKDVVGDDSYDDFMKRVTEHLPSNYYFYQVSFPKYRAFDLKLYVNTEMVVPSIYTEGKRYDFIKPDTKPL